MKKKTSKKLGRPKKKRSIQKKANGWANKSKVSLEQTNIKEVVKELYNGEASGSQPRASDTSYIFVAGNRVLIRNLSDEFLNNQYESIITESSEMRRQVNLLDSLQYNMTMEQRFRGLK